MTQLLRRVISKQARLSLHLRDDVPRIVADVTQLRQVVMNLITNASDALGGESRARDAANRHRARRSPGCWPARI